MKNEVRKTTLGFYGCGNMGGAILRNIIDQKICSSNEILVIEREESKCQKLKDELGIHASTDPTELECCEFVLLAFKPQALVEIPKFKAENKVCISILAGSKIEKITTAFPGSKVVRIMPNIPLLYGYGMAGAYFPEGVDFTDEEKNFVTSIFNAGGKTIELAKESDMDSYTTLCGSGPAYFLYLAEQLVHIATKNGYPAEQANQMMRQTLIGAAEMVKNSDLTLTELRKQITSPGGVTEAAVSTWENPETNQIFEKLVQSGIKRSQELS